MQNGSALREGLEQRTLFPFFLTAPLCEHRGSGVEGWAPASLGTHDFSVSSALVGFEGARPKAV